MSAVADVRAELRTWGGAGGIAVAAHVAALALVLAWAAPSEPPLPEPVMTLELPPLVAPVPSSADAPAPAAQPLAAAPAEAPPMAVPPVTAPLPREVVAVAPPKAQPVSAPQPAAMPAPAPLAAPAPAVRAAMAGPVAAPGSDDPRAKKQEMDYFAQVSAHLNRRKVYPAEARKAREQGVVTVRFTVDRQGGVSNVSLKRGSGHDVLDSVTLDLVRRVAPYPRIPASMARDSITLSLPIDYSLRTD